MNQQASVMYMQGQKSTAPAQGDPVHMRSGHFGAVNSLQMALRKLFPAECHSGPIRPQSFFVTSLKPSNSGSNLENVLAPLTSLRQVDLSEIISPNLI